VHGGDPFENSGTSSNSMYQRPAGLKSTINLKHVRHFPSKLIEWPVDDNFTGTEQYGDPENNDEPWAIKFDHRDYETVFVQNLI
jgi:hypothetical protein